MDLASLNILDFKRHLHCSIDVHVIHDPTTHGGSISYAKKRMYQ